MAEAGEKREREESLHQFGEANEELVDPTAKKAKFDSEVEQTEDIPKQIEKETQPLNPKEVKDIKEETNLLPTSSTEALIKDATKLEDAKDITQPIEKETGGKRAREEAESAEGGLEQQGKKIKVDEDNVTKNSYGNVEKGLVKETNPEVIKKGPTDNASSDEDKPVKIGFKTFVDGRECRSYFQRLLANLTIDQALNEYEFVVVSDLVKQGHPDPFRKVGCGIKSIQVKKMAFEAGSQTNVFVLQRHDGTTDDFSVRKCVAKLFPKYALEMDREPKMRGKRGGRGGQRGGRGGRGRGRRGGRRN